MRKRLYLPVWRIPVVAVAVLAVYRLGFFGSHVEGVPISLNQGNLFGELCHMLTVNEPLRQSINETSHCCCQLHPSVGVCIIFPFLCGDVFWGFSSSCGTLTCTKFIGVETGCA